MKGKQCQEFSLEDLMRKNEELELKMKENSKALTYWKGLNKQSVLGMRVYKKEIKALTTANDEKFESLTKEVQQSNSAVQDLTVNLRNVDALLERATLRIHEREEAYTVERNRDIEEFNQRENTLNLNIIDLETTSNKKADQVNGLEQKLKPLEGIHDKYVKLEANFAEKEKSLKETSKTHDGLAAKLSQKEKELQRVKQELLDKDKQIKDTEEFFAQQIAKMTEECKLSYRIRRFFMRKPQSLEEEEKSKGKMGCMVRLRRIFKRKSQNESAVVEGEIPSTSKQM